MNTILPTTVIKKLAFHMGSDKDVIASSFARITSHELVQNGMPVEGGLYDSGMGTIDYKYLCRTCHNKKSECFGHDGHLVLKYPVLSPLAVLDIRKWVKLICFNCGKPTVQREDTKRVMVKDSKNLLDY